MTFANIGTLGVKPGHRDDVVAILTRRSADLAAAGCLSYEVGVSDEHPNTVYISELWVSAEDHQSSLQLASVQTAIKEAMPMLSGEMGGNRFDVVGSPLRD